MSSIYLAELPPTGTTPSKTVSKTLDASGNASEKIKCRAFGLTHTSLMQFP